MSRVSSVCNDMKLLKGLISLISLLLSIKVRKVRRMMEIIIKLNIGLITGTVDNGYSQ